jgi:hypothetical protein
MSGVAAQGVSLDKQFQRRTNVTVSTSGPVGSVTTRHGYWSSPQAQALAACGV